MHLVLAGAGNMGGAMLMRWLASGMRPDDVTVIDPHPSGSVAEALTGTSARVLAAAPGEASPADVLMIAVKPQMAREAVPPLGVFKGENTVIVSVAAGITLATLERLLGPGAFVRAMPNTPALVGRGITGAFAGEAVSAAQKDVVSRLLGAVGPVEWVDDEELIDAVTAVSGSGPAYVFHLVECMAAAGEKAGLPTDLSMRLARATVAGAGEMLHASDVAAGTLRKNVTSPGGTTQAALSVLMEEQGMAELFARAILAAKTRAGELAG